jgi:hypothetical protein
VETFPHEENKKGQGEKIPVKNAVKAEVKSMSSAS